MRYRIFLTPFILIFCIYCFGQKQRMAILPSTMNYGNNTTLKTLCIDYLREGPSSGIFYKNVLYSEGAENNLIDAIGKKYSIEGYSGNAEMRIMDPEGKVIAPSSIPNLVVIGYEKEQIAERYLEYINKKISKYGGSAFNTTEHYKLQDEVWHYNVLDILGYLKNEGDVLNDFDNGKLAFFKDFTNEKEELYQLLKLGKDLQQYDKQNLSKEDGYVALLVRKTPANEYVVFKGAQRPIYRGKEESVLASKIEETFDQYDNVHLFLENFENKQKEEAFLSTIRIKLLGSSKKFGITKVPKDGIADILKEKTSNLKLNEKLSKNSIIKTTYNQREYYKTTISFETKNGFIQEKGVVDALSIRKNILENFIDQTISLLNDLKTDISLKLFFNSFKKELKETMKIETDDEFMIIFKNEFEEIRILKIKGNDNFYLIS